MTSATITAINAVAATLAIRQPRSNGSTVSAGHSVDTERQLPSARHAELHSCGSCSGDIGADVLGSLVGIPGKKQGLRTSTGWVQKTPPLSTQSAQVVSCRKQSGKLAQAPLQMQLLAGWHVMSMGHHRDATSTVHCVHDDTAAFPSPALTSGKQHNPNSSSSSIGGRGSRIPILLFHIVELTT
ncbi:hypothetical protein DQ04_17201000 [Trypanosoma grayi]|uniref:hypothetical protein n=1 Tax=Trypanosoma grayi TaxID=71804 RepID=UPI0004F45154|nr:hypothetical protein DQ04_17201000 [Trypanosoma grayi]KEG05932.1 hypothetical protein DQ04_17201000 [Trypanosoma grayi]